MRKARIALGLVALSSGLALAFRAAFLAGAHDYVLTLACAVAAASALRAGVDLLAPEVAE